ncbi:MAG TPA: alpha/beta hydrolase [Bryobacteraceae bacterium]|nr:alpha/beta hydrolase [Bryobacteraceae bacterium]
MKRGDLCRLLPLLAAALAARMAMAEDTGRVIAQKDVVYGRTDGAALLADISYPDGKDHLPVIVMVHGGRWRAGSKNDDNYAKQEGWARNGFFAMNIDYRLVNSTPAPACYQDMYTAIRWVHAHASEYHIDVSRIYLMGNSSGGHEVALAATLGAGPYGKTGGWDKDSDDFRAAIAFSGAYDLNTLSWGNLWTPITGSASTGFATLAGAALEEARRIASPIHNIGPQTKPMLLLHSDDDRSVPVQQALDMDKALTAAHVRHKFIHYTDRGHIGFTDEAMREARGFIADLESSMPAGGSSARN